MTANLLSFTSKITIVRKNIFISGLPKKQTLSTTVLASKMDSAMPSPMEVDVDCQILKVVSESKINSIESLAMEVNEEVKKNETSTAIGDNVNDKILLDSHRNNPFAAVTKGLI